MIKDKKVIIFDLDGTLIDSVGVWNAIDEEVIKKIGNGKLDEIDIGKQRDKKLAEFSKCEDSYLEYCGFLGEKYNSTLDKHEIKELRYSIASKYLKEVVDYKPLAPETIKYLKEKGFTLVIASTTNDYTISVYKNENQNIISKAPLDNYFSLILSKGAVKELKPNPEIHFNVMEKLNVKANECIVIEDSVIGVKAASNAGIEVVVMYDKYSDSSRDEINSIANYKFDNFEQFLNSIKEELEN